MLESSGLVGASALPSVAGADATTADPLSHLRTVRSRHLTDSSWLMPAHFGAPQWGGEQPYPDPLGEASYGDEEAITIRYLTDEKQVLQYLPEPYELNGPPTVTIAYGRNRQINWLAGGDYNIVKVAVDATYPGQVDRVSGGYVLVLWENLTDPILPGREFQGMPKIYADIENHRIYDGTWMTTVSNRGKTMLDLQASNLKQIQGEEFETFRNDRRNGGMPGWKYIPGESSVDEPLVSYATEFPTTTEYHEAWSADGTFEWHSLAWQDNPTQSHIVNALHALPVKEIMSCTVTKASKVLQVAKVRRLR
ncbi:MAG: acetoacetate decarboxylase family protein [Fuerstiella sp.]|nr:acetoacetate decarboxylase family protein [Fuerstiella sp.]